MVKDISKKYRNIHGKTNAKYKEPEDKSLWKCIGCHDVFKIQELPIGCTCLCAGKHFVCNRCFTLDYNVDKWNKFLDTLDIDHSLQHLLATNIRESEVKEVENIEDAKISNIEWHNAGTGVQKRF